jgi:cytochrome c
MVRILTISAATLVSLALASPALAGDAAAGASAFHSQCALCHATTASSAVGPGMAGVVGRKAGTLPSFASRYSPAMKGANLTWTPAKLTAYIANPQAVVKGNRMPFAGISNPAQVADIVAYLETLK